MGATYHKIFFHLIWGTYKRLELIDGSIEQHLKKLIEYKLQEFNSKLLCFGCTGDHVHLLVQAHSSNSVAELVGSIKGYSSYMLSNQICPNSGIRWQRGYSVHSLSEKDLPRIIRYIESQKEHHR